jgi:hypothetical protein
MTSWDLPCHSSRGNEECHEKPVRIASQTRHLKILVMCYHTADLVSLVRKHYHSFLKAFNNRNLGKMGKKASVAYFKILSNN